MDAPDGWALSADGKALEKSFRFMDFSEAFGFLTVLIEKQIEVVEEKAPAFAR